MRTRWIAAGIFLVSLAAGTVPAHAQPQPPAGDETARLVDEVAGLNRSLEKLVVMLEQVMFQQQVDLMLKRIELKERRLEPMASHLRSLQREYDDRKSELKHLQETLELEEDRISDEIREGTDRPDSASRTMVKELERVLAVETARIEDLERRMRRLEDDLAEGREEVLVLDEQLQEMLQ
jgi:chromosome segregation ATPase